MFLTNDNHGQQNLFDSVYWMNKGIKNKLSKSWAPVFYEHVFCRIDEQPFSVLYGSTGKPNFPVNILLSLEYIKYMKDCNDIELVEGFHFDYLVNYAVGNRVLGERNLAERTLYYFRKRLYEYLIDNPDKEDLLFGQFIQLLREFAEKAGVTLDEQRTDTTLFMSNIKKAGRISLAYDVLMKAVAAIPKENLPESLSQVLEPDFKTNMLYRAKAQDGDSKLAQLLNYCQEALNILELQLDMGDSEALRIVKRFINEQSTTEQDGKRVPNPKKEITSNSLQSAHDEDATYRTKGNVGQSGYSLEVTETCSKDNDFQLITDYDVAPNNTHDTEMLETRIEVIKDNTGCTDMYVDGGFHGDGVNQKATENDMKIHLTNMSGTKPSKNMPVTDFEIDEASNLIVKCPAGHTPTRSSICKSQTTAHFPHEACAKCEFREQCYSKTQKKDCVVRISLKAVKVGRERAAMEASRKENTSKRAAIEGSISGIKRTGLNDMKVRGKTKCKMVSGLMVTAQNIKRFIKYLQGGYDSKPQKSVDATTTGAIVPNFS